MTTKNCPSCQTEKPESEFWRERTRGRLKSHCKACSVASTKRWRKANPNYEKERYKKTRRQTRERHLVRKYGVTLADYSAMLSSQNGRCAICQCTEDTQHNGVFHVDHCHETGRVRGLLCWGCNHVLGHVKDDPEVLRRAIDYVVPQVVEVIGHAIARAA